MLRGSADATPRSSGDDRATMSLVMPAALFEELNA